MVTLALASVAWGYTFITNSSTGQPIKWPAGTIPITIMADNSIALSDGSTQAATIQAAMLDATRGWNQYLGNVQFTAQIQPAGSGGTDHNQINEIFFSSAPYNYGWDSNTLAVTTGWSSGDQRKEADIIFNTAFTWDSYRGASRATGASGPYDIQRVALHELGHVLGLDHPDEAGQTVSAIMNSVISNIDSLQPDDINGAQILYGAPGILSGNDNFANATAISLNNNSAQVVGNNYRATKETGEPNHAGDAGGHSVWWKWTATNNGVLTVDTVGSNFDTTLAVYTGNSVSSLTSISSNDDTQSGTILTSSCHFNATSGVIYYIAVDGYGGDTGAVAINLSFHRTIPLAITVQPQSYTTYLGGSIALGVSAESSEGITYYQWRKNGIDIPNNINGPALIFTNIQLSDAGDYSVVVSTSTESILSSVATLTVLGAPGAIVACSGRNHTLFITTGGALWGMGANGFGELGVANGGVSTTVPVQIASNIASIAAGAAHSLFIKPDNTLWATGFSLYGQFGDGSSQQHHSTPTQVASNVLLASGGGNFSMHIKLDLTLWATGENNYGQLGDGTVTDKFIWEQVASDVLSVATGEEHTLLIKGDGSLWAVGNNSSGQLGDGTTISRSTYVQIAKNVKKVFAGPRDSYFIKTDGTLWGMGGNESGELGDGSYTSRSSPVLISSNVMFVAAGNEHTLFVKADGSLWSMGDNTYGELGVGTTVTTSTPQLVSSNVLSASAGGGFSTFIKTDGSLWGMGLNNTNALGLKVYNTTTPLLIVAAPPNTPVGPDITAQPVSQTVAAGRSVTFTATVSGTPVPFYQWRKNGLSIPGAINSSYTIASAATPDAGSYTLVATNSSGSVISEAAMLTIIVAPSNAIITITVE